MFKATYTWELGTTLQPQGKEPGQTDTMKNQAGWHTPNTGISSKATLPSAWRDKCTTPVCCQLWHMVQRHGHWPNKHRTNLRPKWKDVCSTSLTKIEGPTSGSGRGQKSWRNQQFCLKWNGLGQSISTASKMTDGPRDWTNTGVTQSGRPSPNHATLQLPNDDDDDKLLQHSEILRWSGEESE